MIQFIILIFAVTTAAVPQVETPEMKKLKNIIELIKLEVPTSALRDRELLLALKKFNHKNYPVVSLNPAPTRPTSFNSFDYINNDNHFSNGFNTPLTDQFDRAGGTPFSVQGTNLPFASTNQKVTGVGTLPDLSSESVLLEENLDSGTVTIHDNLIIPDSLVNNINDNHSRNPGGNILALLNSSAVGIPLVPGKSLQTEPRPPSNSRTFEDQFTVSVDGKSVAKNENTFNINSDILEIDDTGEVKITNDAVTFEPDPSTQSSLGSDLKEVDERNPQKFLLRGNSHFIDPRLHMENENVEHFVFTFPTLGRCPEGTRPTPDGKCRKPFIMPSIRGIPLQFSKTLNDPVNNQRPLDNRDPILQVENLHSSHVSKRNSPQIDPTSDLDVVTIPRSLLRSSNEQLLELLLNRQQVRTIGGRRLGKQLSETFPPESPLIVTTDNDLPERTDSINSPDSPLIITTDKGDLPETINSITSPGSLIVTTDTDNAPGPVSPTSLASGPLIVTAEVEDEPNIAKPVSSSGFPLIVTTDTDEVTPDLNDVLSDSNDKEINVVLANTPVLPHNRNVPNPNLVLLPGSQPTLLTSLKDNELDVVIDSEGSDLQPNSVELPPVVVDTSNLIGVPSNNDGPLHVSVDDSSPELTVRIDPQTRTLVRLPGDKVKTGTRDSDEDRTDERYYHENEMNRFDRYLALQNFPIDSSLSELHALHRERLLRARKEDLQRRVEVGDVNYVSVENITPLNLEPSATDALIVTVEDKSKEVTDSTSDENLPDIFRVLSARDEKLNEGLLKESVRKLQPTKAPRLNTVNGLVVELEDAIDDGSSEEKNELIHIGNPRKISSYVDIDFLEPVDESDEYIEKETTDLYFPPVYTTHHIPPPKKGVKKPTFRKPSLSYGVPRAPPVVSSSYGAPASTYRTPGMFKTSLTSSYGVPSSNYKTPRVSSKPSSSSYGPPKAESIYRAPTSSAFRHSNSFSKPHRTRFNTYSSKPSVQPFYHAQSFGRHGNSFRGSTPNKQGSYNNRFSRFGSQHYMGNSRQNNHLTFQRSHKPSPYIRRSRGRYNSRTGHSVNRRRGWATKSYPTHRRRSLSLWEWANQ